MRIGRRWIAKHKIRNNRHDEVMLVIEPDSSQRNDILIVMNRDGGVAMRIDADGGVTFNQTVAFWNVETEQYERLVLGDDPMTS
jgi:hypothetical protein